MAASLQLASAPYQRRRQAPDHSGHPCARSGETSHLARRGPSGRLAGRHGRQRPLDAVAVDPVRADLRMSRDDRRQIAPAQRARELAGLRARDPAEPVRVLAALAGNDVLTAAQEQDGLRIRIVEVDPHRRAGDRDPPIDLQLGVALEPRPPVAVAALRPKGAVARAPILEPPVDDHLDRRVIRESVAQRPTRVLPVSRDHDQYRARTVLHGLTLLA